MYSQVLELECISKIPFLLDLECITITKLELKYINKSPFVYILLKSPFVLQLKCIDKSPFVVDVKIYH